MPSVFSTMSPKASGESSRPRALIGICTDAPSGVGGPPREPAETSMFCSRMASTISPAVSSREAARAGSIQMRMAYTPAPKVIAWPTPGRRAISSRMRRLTKFDRYSSS